MKTKRGSIEASTWEQQAYLKASNTDAPAQFATGDRFGGSVALSGDGSTLAVGAPDEGSPASGLDGDQTNQPEGGSSGAAYLFVRSASTWRQQTYVKASRSGINDQFSTSVALAASGVTLAVGAPGELGTGTGVRLDLPPTNHATSQTGAAYVYR